MPGSGIKTEGARDQLQVLGDHDLRGLFGLNWNKFDDYVRSSPEASNDFVFLIARHNGKTRPYPIKHASGNPVEALRHLSGNEVCGEGGRVRRRQKVRNEG